MLPETLSVFCLALQQAGEIDLDEQSMTLWARLVTSLAQILLGAVIGAGATKGYLDYRARFAQTSLSPAERAAVASHLARRGETEEAALLSAAGPAMHEAQTALLNGLSPEERRAVAARLAQSGSGMGIETGKWITEPPASAILTSREAAAALRAEAQERRAVALEREAEELAAGPPPAALNARDSRNLLELWKLAEEAFVAWVRSPSDQWLLLLDSAAGPAAALDLLEQSLANEAADAGMGKRQPRFVQELRDELALARMVLEHTRTALAEGTPARTRSIQIANAAQYALREMPAAGEILRKLSFEEALQSL